MQVLRDQSGGGGQPELRPVTRGKREGVKQWPENGHVVYGRPVFDFSFGFYW